MLTKMTSIMSNISHPLQGTVVAWSSSFSHRLLHPSAGRNAITGRSPRLQKVLKLNSTTEAFYLCRHLPFILCHFTSILNNICIYVYSVLIFSGFYVHFYTFVYCRAAVKVEIRLINKFLNQAIEYVYNSVHSINKTTLHLPHHR